MLQDPSIDPALKARIRANITEKKRGFSRMLTTCSIEQLKESGLVPPDSSAKQAKRLINEKHDQLVDAMYNLMAEGDRVAPWEEQWFRKALFYLPPKEFRRRHPGMNEATQNGSLMAGYDDDKLETV